jgi:hypothetical protein
MIELKNGNYYKIDNKQIVLIIQVLEKVVKLRFIVGSTIFNKEKNQTIHKDSFFYRRIVELTPLEVELL